MTDKDRALLDSLTKGDEFTVNCHKRPLTVHSNAEFMGAIVLDAYDNRGAHWPIGIVNGTLYLGYSQLKNPDEQQRAKIINSVTVQMRQK